MSKVLTIIGRNLKIYSNSKLSYLMIILGPLILMLIMGAVLQNTSLKNIKAGIFSEIDENLRDNFINSLEERSYKVSTENSLESCKKNVIEEVTHVCIHLKNSQVNLEDISQGYESYDVDIYVDFSKQRVVWGIIGSIQGLVEEESYSARKNLINNIRDDATDLSVSISSIESKLSIAINRIEYLEDIIEEIEKNNSQNKLEINNLQLILENSRQDLENIQNAGLVTEEPYASDLEEVINNLGSLSTGLENIENRLSPGGFTLLSEIRNIKTGMINTKNSISNLKSKIQNFRDINIERLAEPITLSYYSVSDNQEEGNIEERLESLDYLFPSFLIFFLLFGSLIFSTITIIKERSSNAYIRNITSKNKGATLITGNILTVLVLIVIQIAIILFIASFFLRLDILSNLSSLTPIILISTLLFILIGIALGYITNSYETAVIVSISLSLLFLIFSSIITPVETLPGIISEIIKLSPLTLLETKLRVILIFNSAFKLNIPEIISIISVLLITCALIWIFYKKSKEKEI